MIVIPDIHGRHFWESAVEKRSPEEEVVFLGDYLDPYPDEWTEDINLVRRDNIDNFKKIIELKKNSSNIVLLLGNHDCEYAYSRYVCDCRRDRIHYDEIQNLFRDNYKLFDIAYEKVIGGKRFIFSHAGILKHWLEEHGYPNDGSVNIINYLNGLNQTSLGSTFPEDTEFCISLGDVDYWRGGYTDFGSIVWNDVRSVLQQDRPLYPEGIHVFGHTQLKDRIVDEEHNIMCLDCRRGFRINDNTGNLEEL